MFYYFCYQRTASATCNALTVSHNLVSQNLVSIVIPGASDAASGSKTNIALGDGKIFVLFSLSLTSTILRLITLNSSTLSVIKSLQISNSNFFNPQGAFGFDPISKSLFFPFVPPAPNNKQVTIAKVNPDTFLPKSYINLVEDGT